MSENPKDTKIAKNILLYGIGGILSQAAGLITLPLMVHTLTSAEYGTIEVITAATGYFSILIGLNTLSGLYRFFYEAENNRDNQKTLVSTAVIFVILCGIIVGLVSYFLSPIFSRNLFNSPDNTRNIQLAFWALIPVALYNYSMGLLRIQNRALAYNIISLIVSAFYMGSIVVLMGSLKVGIPGYYYSQIIANSVGTAIALFLSRHFLIFRFSRFWFTKLAKYSFPLIPGSLFAWSLSANNRLFLNASTDPIQVAYYGLANKAAIVITLATQAFCNAWEPTMYALLKQEEKMREKLPTVLTLYGFGTLCICILMMTCARELFLLLAPPEYLAGVGLLGIIQLRWIFTMGVYIIDPGTAKSGKTYWVTVMLGIAVVVNLLCNAILTPLLGLYGAVLSELIGYAAAMVGRWIISNHFFPIRWNYQYFSRAVIFYSLFASAQTFIIFSDLTWLWGFLIRSGLGIIFIIILWNSMDSVSKKTILNILNNFLKKINITKKPVQ